jgi:serine/threonine protein kinase
MTFAPGTRLGPYEIVVFLGAGGMGQVYRARDTQLKREVALKVLPPEVAADADRLARFQREAELLAALNHPHIAQIHGIVETGSSAGPGQAGSGRHGGRALVMELVEGETLADRIGRGPVPVEEALPLARQLAEALEFAHERGIIHRDLKPGNVKITPEGKLKVLDFGLAKAFDARAATGDPNASPTLTSPAMTQAGIILGTAAYMSPEQARGAAVDKRTDIWAFGVVLFEMLTGRPCFPGDSVTDILAAVVKSDPDWAALPADTPRSVRDLLRRCLAKDRRQRLHDIADARLEIEAALTRYTASLNVPSGSMTSTVEASWPRWGGEAKAE